MSSSNGEFGPPSDGDAANAPVTASEPSLPDGENMFELSVESGDVVTSDTPQTPTGQLGKTDPAIDTSSLAIDATAQAIAFDATMDEVSFNAAMDEQSFAESNSGFDATVGEISFDASMDEQAFAASNAGLGELATTPEIPMATDAGVSSSGFGALTDEAPAAQSSADSEVTHLRRQLDSARSELRIVVSQLNDLEKIRSYALQRSSEILMLKARQISLESEVDLYRELTVQYRADFQGLEVRLLDAEGADDGLGLGEADAEIGSLQEELNRASRDRDEARNEAKRLMGDLATLRESDSRAPLLARIDELETNLAASGGAGDMGEEHAQLEARAHSLQAELFKAQSDASEAGQRAERLKVALERLRQAFVRTAEQSERVPGLEEQVTSLTSALAEAQAAPPESAAAKRIEALEAELAASNDRVRALESQGAGQGAEFQSQIDALTAELEAAQGFSAELGDEGERAVEVVNLRRKTTDLELQVNALTRQLEEAADRVATAAPVAPEGGDSERLDRLRIAVQRSSAQVQRLLLELEGSRGSVQRARRDMQRYSRSVNALHEALNHLERYLIGAGPQAQQGVILLQEVKRCAHDVRAMVESNDRFGRSMSKVVERLSSIVSES
ncbi:MAG: hypothetical protein ACPGU1_18405 [Myxococcota bacterium]